MIDGTELWRDLLSIDLCQKKLPGNRTIETYRDIPENLYDALAVSAAKSPGKTAVIGDDGYRITYEDLKKKIDSFAFYLKHEEGVSKGAHIGLMLFNSLEFCVAFLAIIKLGGVCISLPTKYQEPEIHSLLDKSDADLIICDVVYSSWFDSYRAKGIHTLISDPHSHYGFKEYRCINEIAEKSDSLPDDPVLLAFTSGTTSQSKGVLLRNYNIMHAIVSYKLTLGITSEDISIIPIPLYLITGMIAVMGLFLYVGGTVYLHKVFNAFRVLQYVQKHNITFIHASPTVFSLLLSRSSDFPHLPSLRKFACGSSNMPKEKILQLHQWLPKCEFHTVYGLTETTSPATIFPVDAATSPYLGSSGLPIPGLCFKVLQENNAEAPVGTIGEIMIKGTNVLASYYKCDTPLLEHGWLRTGDIGYFNAKGYLYIVDRKKDMINRGGEKITSFDVENEIYRIPEITDAAVVGIPDSLYGEVPVAVVTLSPSTGLRPEKIMDILKGRLAHYMVPVQIKILNRIPETPNGKVDKAYIRTLFIPR